MKSIQVHAGDTLESLIEGKEAPSAEIRISIRLPNKENDKEMNKVYKEDAEQIYAVLCMFLPEGTRRYLKRMIKKDEKLLIGAGQSHLFEDLKKENENV